MKYTTKLLLLLASSTFSYRISKQQAYGLIKLDRSKRAAKFNWSFERLYQSTLEKQCYESIFCDFEEFAERAEDQIGLKECRDEKYHEIFSIRYQKCILEDIYVDGIEKFDGVDKSHCVWQFVRGIENVNSFYCSPECKFNKLMKAQNASKQPGPNSRTHQKNSQIGGDSPVSPPTFHLDPTGRPLPDHLKNSVNSTAAGPISKPKFHLDPTGKPLPANLADNN